MSTPRVFGGQLYMDSRNESPFHRIYNNAVEEGRAAVKTQHDLLQKIKSLRNKIGSLDSLTPSSEDYQLLKKLEDQLLRDYEIDLSDRWTAK